MVVILEKEGSKRCALEATNIEAFTQKTFLDLIKDSHNRKCDYYIARVRCLSKMESLKGAGFNVSGVYYCYDARQLCKYVFEMVISADGRRIRIKNFKDPIQQRTISELNFFRLRYETDTPLRAEYVGNHIDFLESNCFRSKLFYKEDPLDALTVNFNFKKNQKIPIFSKKQIFSLFITIIFILLLSTFLVIALEKDRHILNPIYALKSKLMV
ncbi:DUF5092 domain-containing protein [Hamiltosporidium tvaerminnensis]|uniref:DUF5092 domain-containing protein n=2 Tax=Hamiltosporidium TaxID=1176354 RepID=A0A4Q9LN59_9MICR|nr:DUF5092 domain-containing protein [Hamiltosporidium tvaerminnensis]TBU08690.1 DUF5092 domain-containing protein [Hamiltosporidium magnivora]TBU09395.1 hypothetical protein CWI36_0034p0070 [Hamiltosporidium magnivora]TBU11578.1 DUF5092 domain-containing protein [Hamiltosporidium tvaerminnensis]